jgi:acyl-CoA synthetase (AMP-forming)/AMP-acid ligase II
VSRLEDIDFSAAQALTLPRLLQRRAEETPDAIAVRSVTGHLTFGAWARRANHLARILEEMGIAPDLRGERVLIWMSNEDATQFVAAFQAILATGAIVVPLDDRMSALDVRRIIDQTEPQALVVSHAIYGNLGADACRELGLGPLPEDPAEVDVVAFSDGRVRDVVRWDLGEADGFSGGLSDRALPGDDAFIAFTSGSTGQPKGALLTHGGASAYAERVVNFIYARPRNVERLMAGDVVQSPIPLYTTASLIENFYPTILSGCTLLYEGRRFDPAASEATMAAAGTTIYNGAPAHAAMMCALPPGEHEAARPQMMIVGGSALTRSLYSQMRERWPSAAIANWYGLNETGPGQTLNFGEDIERDPGSIGRPVWPTQLRIAGGDARQVPDGLEGELWLRAPGQISRYFRNPEATAQRVQDGWIRTGDRAVRGEDGLIRLLGRNEDRINRGGFKFYPAEIEDVLEQHEAVVEAAAFGIPHPLLGEDAVAVVALAPDNRVGEEELRDFCRGRLARNKVPSRIVFVDQLPRNQYAKVIRREVRVQYERAVAHEPEPA